MLKIPWTFSEWKMHSHFSRSSSRCGNHDITLRIRGYHNMYHHSPASLLTLSLPKLPFMPNWKSAFSWNTDRLTTDTYPEDFVSHQYYEVAAQTAKVATHNRVSYIQAHFDRIQKVELGLLFPGFLDHLIDQSPWRFPDFYSIFFYFSILMFNF